MFLRPSRISAKRGEANRSRLIIINYFLTNLLINFLKFKRDGLRSFKHLKIKLEPVIAEELRKRGMKVIQNEALLPPSDIVYVTRPSIENSYLYFSKIVYMNSCAPVSEQRVYLVARVAGNESSK